MQLLLNYTDNIQKINDKLLRLRTYYFSENMKTFANLLKFNKFNIDRLAKYISQIHSYNLIQNKKPIYNSEWVINFTNENAEAEYKDIIISALKIISQLEYYNEAVTIKDNKFLTWDICNNNWYRTYDTGYIGSYVWDISAIISYVNNSAFSDIFLERYLKHSKKKPTISALYANIYYIQVVNAILNRNIINMIISAQEIISDNRFNNNIISYDTLIRLNITGYN